MVAAKDFETPLEVDDVMESLPSELGKVVITNAAHEAVFVVKTEYDGEGGIIMEMSDGSQFIIPEVRKRK